MTEDVYMHFRPEEQPFADKVSDWLGRAADRHETKLTDFLDPRQAHILAVLAARYPEAQYMLAGGYEQAERKRAMIMPYYASPDSVDMSLSVLVVQSADHKAADLDHGDYMGAILGLGLKRDKIGDIHVKPDGCHYVVATETAGYLDLQLRQVHRIQVHTELLPVSRLIPTPQSLEEMAISVASLRLDGIASDVYRLSRTKIIDPIKAGRCRVNWKTEPNPSRPLKDGDVVSMQGFGRFKVLEVEGITKSGRQRVRIGKFV